MRKGVHDNVDPHLNGFFVVMPAEGEAVAVTPSAMNIGGAEKDGQPVADKNTSGAVILALHNG